MTTENSLFAHWAGVDHPEQTAALGELDQLFHRNTQQTM